MINTNQEHEGVKKYGVIATDKSLTEKYNNKIVARDKIWLFDSYNKAEECISLLNKNKDWSNIQIKLFYSIIEE